MEYGKNCTSQMSKEWIAVYFTLALLVFPPFLPYFGFFSELNNH